LSEKPGLSLFLGEYGIPLDIARTALDENGSQLAVGRRDVNFHFRYRDLSIAAHLFNDGATSHLALSAWLGRFPFSAESAAQRQALSTIIRGANDDFGPILSLAQGKIALSVQLPLSVPVTAVGLVTGMTQFLLRLKPYLDLMAMVRLMGRSGTH
jgi:hypothetical protein